MSKYLDENGLLYLWGKVKTLAGGREDSVDWSDVRNKPDLALKSDLASLYRYKGSVTNYTSLPTANNQAGDVWNVKATGMNYAWTGEEWDALGQFFEIQAITNAEIDQITSGG